MYVIEIIVRVCETGSDEAPKEYSRILARQTEKGAARVFDHIKRTASNLPSDSILDN